MRASQEEVGKDLLKAAIVYDFDGTLARGNIQERSFIPSVGLTHEEFWSRVKQTAREQDADEILCYMQLLIELANKAGIPVTEEQFRRHGECVDLFPGLADGSWFGRMNDFAAENGLLLRHYVISSGTYEMIRGCPIFDYFHQVFASKFIYEGGIATWPGLAINYTSKTQFLFRINKGISNSWDSESLNGYMPDGRRPVPFSRMIFVGDGDTDIPSMKMMTHQGGYSIAVYDPEGEERSIRKIHKLISEDRVNFVAPADFRRDMQMDIITKGILGRISRVAYEALTRS
ncbi:MAG: HAD family hydrolase [Acetobacteraceae bacterium]